MSNENIGDDERTDTRNRGVTQRSGETYTYDGCLTILLTGFAHKRLRSDLGYLFGTIPGSPESTRRVMHREMHQPNSQRQVHSHLFIDGSAAARRIRAPTRSKPASTTCTPSWRRAPSCFEPVIFPTRPISRFGWDDARAASTVVPEKCCCSAEAARTRCSTSACALLPPQHGRAIATTTAANTQRHEQNESIVWVARL